MMRLRKDDDQHSVTAAKEERRRLQKPMWQISEVKSVRAQLPTRRTTVTSTDELQRSQELRGSSKLATTTGRRGKEQKQSVLQPNKRKKRLRWLPLWREPAPLRLRSTLQQRPCCVKQLILNSGCTLKVTIKHIAIAPRWRQRSRQEWCRSCWHQDACRSRMAGRQEDSSTRHQRAAQW